MELAFYVRDDPTLQVDKKYGEIQSIFNTHSLSFGYPGP